MRYLGIDYGTKKVGLALSDEGGVMGFPHSIIPNDAQLLETLVQLIQEQKVGAVVIGESLNSSGTENPVAKDARVLGTTLAEKAQVPVNYEIEAFTTQEARRAIDGTHPQHISTSARQRVVGKQNTGTQVDASAAALILTSYLSRDHGNN